MDRLGNGARRDWRNSIRTKARSASSAPRSKNTPTISGGVSEDPQKGEGWSPSLRAGAGSAEWILPTGGMALGTPRSCLSVTPYREGIPKQCHAYCSGTWREEGGWMGTKSRQNPPFSCPHPQRKHLFPCGDQDQLAVLMQGCESCWFLLEKEFMSRKVHPSKQAGKQEWENFLVLQHCTWVWEVQNVLGEGKLRI